MKYPQTRFDKAQDRAIAQENDRALADLAAAGPDACPNCLKTGGGHCWLCVDEDERLANALEKADAAFWSVIAEAYPEITTGDLDPFTVHGLCSEMESAVRAWITANSEEAS